jgi:hypothetical protein
LLGEQDRIVGIPAMSCSAGSSEFFAANIRNPRTRRAYARTVDEFPA